MSLSSDTAPNTSFLERSRLCIIWLVSPWVSCFRWGTSELASTSTNRRWKGNTRWRNITTNTTEEEATTDSVCGWEGGRPLCHLRSTTVLDFTADEARSESWPLCLVYIILPSSIGQRGNARLSLPMGMNRHSLSVVSHARTLVVTPFRNIGHICVPDSMFGRSSCGVFNT